MMASVLRLATFALSALALTAAQPSLADGGGGGGGGSPAGAMPGASSPKYDPVAEYKKGAAAYSAKDYKAAAAAFKRVTAAVPKHAPAQYLLGASYAGMGDFKKAKRSLEIAVKLDPALLDAQRDLGIAYAKTGDGAKAARQRAGLAARKAACAGTCPEARRIEAALAAVDAAVAGAPPQALGPTRPIIDAGSVDANYVAAVGLINLGRYGPAIDVLEAAIWRSGPHPDLLTYLGFANRKLGRFERARAWYEEALAVAPDHRGAIEYYGELKLELGDRAGALRHLTRLDRLCGFGCEQADELRRWIVETERQAS